MRIFWFGLSLIALCPLPAFSEPLNLPICYIITANQRVIDLTYLCVGNQSIQASGTNYPKVTASDVCRAFASDVLTATNQFQRDRANEGLSFCLKNKDRIQNDFDNEKP